MDRLHGAPDALARVRALLWPTPDRLFDSAFAANGDDAGDDARPAGGSAGSAA
jgi:hypothetical protein